MLSEYLFKYNSSNDLYKEHQSEIRVSNLFDF